MNRTSLCPSLSGLAITIAVALLLACGLLRLSASAQDGGMMMKDMGMKEKGMSGGMMSKGMPAKLMREGSRIDTALITFRAAGDRLTAQLADQRTVTALENLAAQRVLKAVIEDPKDNEWKVDGTITEFNGRNFLLLERVKRGGR